MLEQKLPPCTLLHELVDGAFSADVDRLTINGIQHHPMTPFITLVHADKHTGHACLDIVCRMRACTCTLEHARVSQGWL